MAKVANVIIQDSKHGGDRRSPATKLLKPLRLFVVKYLRENQGKTYQEIAEEFQLAGQKISNKRAHQLYKEALELFTCFLIFLNVFIWLNILGG